MRERVEYDTCGGNPYRKKKKTRKKIEYFLVGCKARGLQKGGFGCGLAIKSRKGKKKSQAERTGLKV
jgi:hypothetical protein